MTITKAYIVKHCKNTGPIPPRTMPDNSWRNTNELHLQRLQDNPRPRGQQDSSSMVSGDGDDDTAPGPKKTAQEMWCEFGPDKVDEDGQAKETEGVSSSPSSSEGGSGDAPSSDAEDNASCSSFDSMYDVTPPKSPKSTATEPAGSRNGPDEQDVSPPASSSDSSGDDSDSDSSSDSSTSSDSGIDHTGHHDTPPDSPEPQAPSINQNPLGPWRRVMITSLGGGEYVFDQEAYELARAQESSRVAAAETIEASSPISSLPSDDSDCNSSADGSSKPSSPILVLLAQDGCGCKGDPLRHFFDEKPPKDQTIGVFDSHVDVGHSPTSPPLRTYLPSSHEAVYSELGTVSKDEAPIICNRAVVRSSRPRLVTTGQPAFDPSFPRRNAVSEASNGDSDFVVACNTALPSDIRHHSADDPRTASAPSGELKDHHPEAQLPVWVLNVNAPLPKPPSPVSCLMVLNRPDGPRDERIERLARDKRTDSFEELEIALAKFKRDTEALRRQIETEMWMRDHEGYAYLHDIALDVFTYEIADGNATAGNEDTESTNLASAHEQDPPVNEHHLPDWVLDVNAPLPNTPPPVVCMGAAVPDIPYFKTIETRTRIHFKDLFDDLRVLQAERNHNALREWQQTFQRRLEFQDLQFYMQLQFFFSWLEGFGDLPAITDDVLSYEVGNVDGDTGSTLGAIEALRLMQNAVQPANHLVIANPVMVAGSRGKQRRGRRAERGQVRSNGMLGPDSSDQNDNDLPLVLPGSPTPIWIREVTAALPMSTSPTTCMISHSGMPNLSFRTIHAHDQTIPVKKTPDSVQEIRDRERRKNIERKREERKETRKWFRALQKRQANAILEAESVGDAALAALMGDDEASQSSC